MAVEMMGSTDGLSKGLKERKEPRVTPGFRLKQWVDGNVTS